MKITIEGGSGHYRNEIDLTGMDILKSGAALGTGLELVTNALLSVARLEDGYKKREEWIREEAMQNAAVRA